MGNIVSSTTPSAATAGIDSYVSELADVQYEKRHALGSARFLKTIRCKHKEGQVVVKIFIKPDPGISLRNFAKQLQLEKNLLFDVPNALPYARVLETEKAGYVIRQHMFSSLYDRISNRPFLNLAEKRWIAYQLLAGVAQAHARQVFHGDIKTENVLVTSWNWAYLSDFSNFKPAYLPEDNPADFSFYFDTSARRTCYLAPERFYSPGETLFAAKEGKVTGSMDVFSLGCTIAELFLEGTSVFTLAQLLRYRSQEYDPSSELEKIKCEHIQSLVKDMIQIDPAKRLTAPQYLQQWRGTAFPGIFYTFLHQYVSSTIDPPTPIVISSPSPATLAPPSLPPSTVVSADTDAKLEKIYFDFGTIAIALGMVSIDEPSEDQNHGPSSGDALSVGDKRRNIGENGLYANRYLPYVLSIPLYSIPVTEITVVPSAREGCIIFMSIICSCIRNTLFPISRMYAIELLLALATQLSDADKLDRCVPYLVTVLADDNGVVRATALKALTQLMALVEEITPAEANIFPEFILPALKRFSSDSDGFVRATYAQCLPSIAETALLFLELSEVFRSVPSDIEGEELHQISYDSSLRELHDSVQDEVIALLVDQEPTVKRSLLAEIARLCVFFGRQRANDVLLSHMLTYLNDVDWQLRAAFFESIVGVGMFLGGWSLEEYILPLMIQSLTDAEEFVVEKVLNSLTALGELGLLQKSKLKELFNIVLPLVCHANIWIRYGAIAFVASTANAVPLIDVRSVLYPMVRPFLKNDIDKMTADQLLDNLKSPVSRVLYDQTLLLASKSGNGNSNFSERLSGESSMESGKPGENDMVSKLREFGMIDEDKDKLIALRYHLFKSSQSNFRVSEVGNQWAHPDDSAFVPLKNFSITPHTVFLSPPESYAEAPTEIKTVTNSRRTVGTDSNTEGSLPPMSPQGSHRFPFTDVPRHSTLSNASSYDGGSDAGAPFIVRGKADLPYIPHGTLAARTTKSSAAVSVVSSETAHGTIDVQLSKKRQGMGVRSPSEANSAVTPMSGSQDKYLRKLLEKKRHQLFPPPIPELGQKVSPLSSSGILAQRRKVRSKKPPPPPLGVSTDLKSWRPEGVLVANLTEHQKAVNRVRVAPDHNFFATCSDDGTVKVWDSHRLEKNVSNRARLSYKAQGGKILSFTFCESTHSIASVSDNGTIHINRVEYIPSASHAPKYEGYIPVRMVTVDEGDYPVMVEHFDTETESMLVYATLGGRLCGLDLRTMKSAWSLDIPPNYGVPTALLIDKRRCWITSATHRGVFSLWDIRFNLQVKSWTHPAKSKVHSIVPYWKSTASNADKMIMTTIEGRTNEISSWDLETGTCKEVWCVVGQAGRGGSDPEEEMNRVYGQGLKALSPPESNDFGFSSLHPVDTTSALNVASTGGRTMSRPHDQSVRAIADLSACDVPYMITAGTDRKIRLWDCNNVNQSFVVCGLDKDEYLPRYTSHTYGGISFSMEYTPSHGLSAATATRNALNPHESPPLLNSSGTSAQTVGILGSETGMMTSPSNVGHLDVITDVALLRAPYTMLLSTSRDGVVKVWK
ncbi:hypothetical protein BJ742DRAFT_686782 [Cladochytrium replicatum]|nr:hypothetical protein BJ742DRAFT_686782 [Cladochytrium replicatum]